MAEEDEFIALQAAEVRPGIALPWPIYDAQGALLLPENFVLNSADEIAGVFRKPLFRKKSDELFVAVTAADMAPGRALPWPIYDRNKTLLQKSGHVFANQAQVARALADGLFRRKSGILSKKDRDLLQEREAAEEARLTDVKNRGRFEDMSARIGDPLLLQVKSSFADERCKVKLIGYVPGRTVIIEAPSGEGNNVAMRVGQSVIARSFSGKLAYGFSTMVKTVCNSPIAYCHLLYPDFVQKVPVRESARVAFNVIGSASPLNEDGTERQEAAAFAVLLVDFSTSGASFVAQSGVAAKGQVLRLSFRIRIQDIEVTPSLQCIVRSSNPVDDSGNGKHRFGLQFKDLQTQDKLVLQSMVYQKMLENV